MHPIVESTTNYYELGLQLLQEAATQCLTILKSRTCTLIFIIGFLVELDKLHRGLLQQIVNQAEEIINSINGNSHFL